MRPRGPARRVREYPAVGTRAAMWAAALRAWGGGHHWTGVDLCGVKACIKGGREGRELAAWVCRHSHSYTLVPSAVLLMRQTTAGEERKVKDKTTQWAELQLGVI